MQTSLTSFECNYLYISLFISHQCMIIDRDCDFIRQLRVIGSSKSAHWLSRDERAIEHPSHLQDKAIIRLSTGHRVESSSRTKRREKDKGLYDGMGLYQSFLSLFLFFLSFPSPPFPSSLRLISSDDDVIRPSHVTLNCSIIFQSLSQPITFAVVPETSVLTRKVGTYARHYMVWHLHEAPVDPTGKYARLLSSRVSAIDNPAREILQYNLCTPWVQSRLSPVCLLTLVESYRRKATFRQNR